MLAANARSVGLSDDDRQIVESWIADFDRNWEEGQLASRVEKIPADSSLRLPALAEMVKIDLERRWSKGYQISLETYLVEYPELGTPGDVSADLILAEYEVRRQFGAPVAIKDYLRRFPAQAGELGRMIARGDSKSPQARSSVSKPKPSPSRLAEQFGRYQILRRLGQGGMGSVYLAKDTKLGRQVALKVPDFGDNDGLEARRRFEEEASTAATLDHPYLCPVFDVGEVDGQPYLTMMYIEGKSLAEAIRADGIPSRQVAALVGKLALAMQEAHDKGVIHRDLKPANVMIKSTGPKREPVIVDFGLARRDDSNDVRLTKTGQVIGTLAYMSPEQIRGELSELGPACDIYALGVMLYELLTGQLPFTGSGLAVAGKILTQNPLVPSVHRPDLDPRLEAICLKAMAKKVSERYLSMRELAGALTKFLQTPQTSGSSSLPLANSSPPTGQESLVRQLFEGLSTENPAIISLRQRPPEPETDAGFGNRRRFWSIIAASAAFGFVLLGIIITIVTDNGRVSLDFAEPNAAVVKVDGKNVTVEGLNEALSFHVGEHQLLIKFANGEFQTKTFTVKRGQNNVLRIKYNPTLASKLAVARPVDLFVGKKEFVSPFTGMTLIRIEPGRFLIGSPEGQGERDEHAGTNRERQITRPFCLGKYEVTQAQYEKVTGRTPSASKNQPNNPVEYVGWLDAVAFCNALSLKENLPLYYVITGTSARLVGGTGYRLPTEAEWEYACRAGSMTQYEFGDDVARLKEYAMFALRGTTDAVGQNRPNAWGLYDMHGNVREWCWDGYEETYYKTSPPSDPPGPLNATRRVNRGGSWFDAAEYCRSAFRGKYDPQERNGGLGFRLARDPAPDGAPSLVKTNVPADAKYFKGVPYKVYIEKIHWEEARKKCVEMGGTLAMIKREEENQFVFTLASLTGLETVWLGATDEKTEGRWLWLDGSEMVYDAWDKDAGQPNNAGAGGVDEDCLAMDLARNGVWWDYPDNDFKERRPGYVCQWPRQTAGDSPSDKPTSPAKANAPADAKVFNRLHYKVFDEKISWQDARKKCEQMGGTLAIIKGEDENRFVLSLVSASRLNSAWLGATDEKVEGRWVWVDGTEMVYNAWDKAAGQPNNLSPDNVTEAYLVIVAFQNGAWWDYPNFDLRQFQPGYVCQWGPSN